MPFKLSLTQVNNLLDKLENDDDFRTLFEADPGAALTSVGAPLEARACLAVGRLASKSVLHESRLALQQQLVGFGELKPHRLDADFHTATVRTLVEGASASAA